MPPGRWTGLAVAGGFHGIVGQSLSLGQRVFHRLLTGIGGREFLADFGRDAGKLRNGSKLDADIRARIDGRVVGIGRQLIESSVILANGMSL